ncbi:MAG: hypothetical protein WC527_08185 [Candidatus Margulisiibacteriota bacterium]
MKKFLSVCLVLAFASSAAFAMTPAALPHGPSARFAAMGGAGSALVDDVTSAYYNPAGMAEAQAMAIKIGAGAATDGLNDMINTLSSAGDPSKFILDNYANALDLNGSANIMIGLDIFKTGISFIPAATLNVSKNANSADGSATATAMGEGVVTIGRGVSVPYLGSLNAGANIKYVADTFGAATVAGATSTTLTSAYTGMGFDLGVQGQVDSIPTMPISVGVVYRDIAETLKGKTSTTTKTIDPATGQVLSESKTPDTDLPDQITPTTLVIGAAAKIPVVGATVAIDLDNVAAASAAQAYSVTHIGLEYPVAMGMVNLRAGTISGGPSGSPINMTTYGAGILGNMINIAMITDNNDKKNNQTMFDIGFGF